MKKYDWESNENIVKDGFPFPPDKGQTIFKKNKIENNNIRNPPDIVHSPFEKCFGIFYQIT